MSEVPASLLKVRKWATPSPRRRPDIVIRLPRIEILAEPKAAARP